jgi:hypothetical protein
MIYAAYLRHKLNHCKYPEREYCRDCTDCFPSLLELSTKAALEEMAKDYSIMYPSRAEDMLYKYRTGLNMELIRQAISKIKKQMTEELKNDALASCYAVTTAFRGYGSTRHGVRVEKGKIKI